MYRSILVPIDISEADLTRHVVPQVQAHAKTAKVHFLAVIPTVPFYASLGLAYSTEFPDRSGLQARPAKNSKKLLSSSIFLPAGLKPTSFTARRRIRSSSWRRRLTPSLSSSPHTNRGLALIYWVQRRQP